MGNLLAGLIVAGAAGTAQASYIQYGAGMQTVLSGQVQNGGLYLQSASTWDNTTPIAGVNAPHAPTSATFLAPACDSVVTARLVMTVWGGTNAYTCGLGVTFNGTSVANLNMGATTDANPTFQGSQANVYGVGSGLWTVSVPVPTNLVKTDGSANSVLVSIDDPTMQFDGRVNQISLASVYQKASLNNSFHYMLAEGSGDIYKSQTGAPKSRTVSLGSADTSRLVSASLSALYTYGDYGQNDRLYFNGVKLGSDDVANHQNNYTALNYVPDLISFDVAGSLAASNAVRFSVDSADGIPGTLETSLRPTWAALAVTQSVPEPGSLALLALGGVALLARRRRA